MFKVGVTNIEDARTDSNKSRFNTISIYFGISIQRDCLSYHTRARIALVQYRVPFSLHVCGSLVRRTEVVFYSTPPQRRGRRFDTGGQAFNISYYHWS